MLCAPQPCYLLCLSPRQNSVAFESTLPEITLQLQFQEFNFVDRREISCVGQVLFSAKESLRLCLNSSYSAKDQQ